MILSMVEVLTARSSRLELGDRSLCVTWSDPLLEGRSAMERLLVCPKTQKSPKIQFQLVRSRVCSCVLFCQTLTHKVSYLRAQIELSGPSTLVICPESSHIIILSKLRGCLASISQDHSPTHFRDPGGSGHSFKKTDKFRGGAFEDE